jgi:hypothetical protein
MDLDEDSLSSDSDESPEDKTYFEQFLHHLSNSSLLIFS